MENKTLNYYISDLNDEAIPISQVYYKLGTLYEKLKEKELVCEYYQKALAAIENETRPDKIEFKSIKSNFAKLIFSTFVKNKSNYKCFVYNFQPTQDG